MMDWSRKGFRADFVSSGRFVRLTTLEIGHLLARWASQAQEFGTLASTRIRARLAQCAAAAAPQIGDMIPATERLEGRTLLSSVSLSGSTLILTGDSGANNSLTVDLQSNGGYWANADGKTLSTAKGSVSKISIIGGAGADTIYINSGISTNAVINTYGGTDSIRGGGGYDTITCGDGNDTIYASGTMTLGNGNNTVWVGSVGGSAISSGNGSSLLVGGPGSDLIVAGSGHNTLIGGAGNDILKAGANSVFPDATAGEKTILSSTGSTTTSSSGSTPTPPSAPSSTPTPPATPSSSQTVGVSLSGGTLTLTGSPTSDNSLTVDLQSNGGFWANANGKTLSTAPGSVSKISIVGGAGIDTIYINPGIKVGAVINTFNGNDSIRGGSGYDTINTGDGNDTVYASGNITLGNGNNTVWVGGTGSSVTAGNGNNLLVGGPGNDVITAGTGKSTLIGGSGSDKLTGGPNSTFPDVSSADTVVHTGGSTSSSGGSSSSSSGSSTTTTPTPPPPPPSTPTSSGSVSSSSEDSTIFGSAHGDGLAPTPVIVLSGNGGQVEHSIFVYALSSSLGSGNYLNATYNWNFGDSGSR
ncbi:MAG TPA: calcium-binding protein, partial [Tepidisphaeraceae bacterium]